MEEISEIVTGKTEISNDDWHSVTDAKKRKQIQDRLAQRARRKRLRDAKRNSTQTWDSEVHTSLDNGPSSSDRALGVTSELSSSESLELIPYLGDHTISTAPVQTQSFCPSMMEPAPNMSYYVSSTPTIFAALFFNSQLLGTPTCSIYKAITAIPSSNLPSSLHPTIIQLTTAHSNWIDRFPFPKMRDNLILLSDLVEGEDFTRDFFTMPTFSISPGIPPYDPKAWKVEPYFANKWGFLLH